MWFQGLGFRDYGVLGFRCVGLQKQRHSAKVICNLIFCVEDRHDPRVMSLPATPPKDDDNFRINAQPGLRVVCYGFKFPGLACNIGALISTMLVLRVPVMYSCCNIPKTKL